MRETEKKYLKWYQKIAYGAGDLASNTIIHAKVTGNGVLEGFGTANPSSEEDYFSDTVTTFEGSALAVVRWKDSNLKESAVLRLWTDDDVEVCIDIGR